MNEEHILLATALVEKGPSFGASGPVGGWATFDIIQGLHWPVLVAGLACPGGRATF